MNVAFAFGVACLCGAGANSQWLDIRRFLRGQEILSRCGSCAPSARSQSVDLDRSAEAMRHPVRTGREGECRASLDWTGEGALARESSEGAEYFSPARECWDQVGISPNAPLRRDRPR